MPRGEQHLTNRPELKAVRQTLRSNGTPAEAVLWTALRQRGLAGRKFRRQHSVGPYVLDFYCPREHLAVELDGSVHDDPIRRRYDERRQAFLEAHGIRILRFPNRAVLDAPEGVLAVIASHFRRP